MISYDTAHQIAAEAHHGQTEKDGGPYIRHLERVAALVNPAHRPLALLHDLFEDTDRGPADLYVAGADLAFIDDVRQLTRDQSVTYSEFVHRIKRDGSDRAFIVKTADVVDHLRPGHENVLTARHAARYVNALAVLTAEGVARNVPLAFPLVEALTDLHEVGLWR